MEITGKVIAVLPLRSGTSTKTGSEWKSQEYVIETVNEQYSRRVCFDAFGDKIEQFHVQEGELLTVSFDIDAREYQGRWYNSIRAWKVERTTAQAVVGGPAAPAYAAAGSAPAPIAAAPAAPQPADSDTGSDLPF